LLAVNRPSSANVWTSAHDSRSAHGLLYLAVPEGWYQQELFSTAWGEPIHPDTVSSLMTTLVNSHNDRQSEPLPHARLHDLRHVHATTLLLAGVPVHVVAARLGHADPSITLRVYAHVISDQLTEAADIFARAVAATT
jgi:integrase